MGVNPVYHSVFTSICYLQNRLLCQGGSESVIGVSLWNVSSKFVSWVFSGMSPYLSSEGWWLLFKRRDGCHEDYCGEKFFADMWIAAAAQIAKCV